MAADRTAGTRRALGWPGAPIAACYRAAVAMRNWTFDRGLRSSHRLDVPVISIGNLTAGGTGKTPAVEWIVRQLQERGRKPAVLLRGYGAPATGATGDTASDETVLLRENLPQVPVIANADRVAGGREAIRLGADACVCDDAFQHRRLARDLDILCVDATDPFGGGHCLPWGLLREPMANAVRAQAMLLTRVDRIDGDALAALRVRCGALLGDGPVLATTHAPAAVLDADGSHALDELEGAHVFVIAGVGNPAAVEATACEAGANVRGSLHRPDHHAWTAADLETCTSAARDAGAELLLTTQKDWVKIRSLPSPSLPVRALRIGLSFADDPAPLLALVDGVLR